MFRTITRITTPIVAGTLAFGLFPLRKSLFIDQPSDSNKEIVESIKQTPLYQAIESNNEFEAINARKQFPSQHQRNLVTSGLLFGKELFEIEPMIFSNKTTGEFYAFHHIGGKLISEDGKIHNGVTATLLDEGLCGAGFPLLPSKKGVTANLSIQFQNQVPPDSNVVIKANVVEHKGRKVVINGSLQTLTNDPTTIATASCVLVEPKWFKYFAWFQFI